MIIKIMKNFADLIKESFEIYRQKIASILILMLIFSGLIMIFGILVSFVAPGDIIENGGYLGVLLILGIYLFMIFLSTFIGFSLMLLVIKPVGIKLKEIFQEVWKKLWQYLLIAILVGFFVMITSFLLIIPGIIVGVYLAFSSFVFIIEEEKGINALKRSWNLVKGNWWKVFGRIMLLVLVFGILFSILGLVDLLLPLLLPIVFLYALLMHFCMFGCVMPFSIIFSYLIYLGLKKSKEVQIQPQA